MVAAYLRGALRPQLAYGLRSSLAENLVLEAVASEVNAAGMEIGAMIDAQITSALKPESRQNHLRSVFARVQRVSELRLFDVHRLSSTVNRAPTNQLSLFQLYKVLEKNGILEAMRQNQSFVTK